MMNVSARLRRVAAGGIVLLPFWLFALTGCFESSDLSARKLRVFYSGDVGGSIEPCG